MDGVYGPGNSYPTGVAVSGGVMSSTAYTPSNYDDITNFTVMLLIHALYADNRGQGLGADCWGASPIVAPKARKGRGRREAMARGESGCRGDS